MSRETLLEMLIRRSRIDQSESSSGSDSSSSGGGGGIPTDYVFYAPLVDASASTAETGQALTYNGTPVEDTVDGIPCLDMRGKFIQAPDTGVNMGTDPITLSAWVYGLSSSTWCSFIDLGYGDTGKQLIIGATSDGVNICGQMYNYYLDSGISMLGSWHNVIFTKKDSVYTLYVDGEQVATTTNTSCSLQSTGYIGLAGHTGPNYNGYLAACRIYNRVVTADEIQSLASEFGESSTSESQSESTSESGSESAIRTVRFAAGVDTTLYLTNNNGVFTAAPSWEGWGGTGYHDGIRDTWVSFYPKHGLKYSLNNGATWLDWCFEDTNATLDLSSVAWGNILGLTKVSGRNTVSLSDQTISIIDNDGSSAIYIIDVAMEGAADQSTSVSISDSGSESQSTSESGSSSGGIPTDYSFYMPLTDYEANTDETGRALVHNGSFQNSTVDGIPCVYFEGNGIYSENYTNLPTGKQPFTQSIWFNATGWDNSALFAFGATGGQSYQSIHLQRRSDSGVVNGGGWYLDYTFNYTFELNTWYHLVQTYDGTTFRGYVNGVLTNEVANSDVDVASGWICVGRQPNSFEPLAYCYLASARLYNRVLTNGEILALANELTPQM